MTLDWPGSNRCLIASRRSYALDSKVTSPGVWPMGAEIILERVDNNNTFSWDETSKNLAAR
ncbi:conserved hypothetical protein [Pyrenophora tritici-repentis Pt-1C-BFP]|uniref:Uncharacterized protein n=1 Tax=Pyrenophora tritici-repentis (strain Pt-1C-BFP) TaxID=426418 RepID=B2WP90_PYRTR|nr:uncharacterized protein PTRG_11800 [Pyrenophora tritici-repentis Pt-1C-BFP]EDU45956.1 conserved hypothetical protein [Pyrenophora tritici-repentis Pt-1C-BFP]